MIWGICNLILSLGEAGIIWGLEFRFMGANGQSIHRKKGWYWAGLILNLALLFAGFLVAPQSWTGFFIQQVLTVATAFLLFHRGLQELVLDLVFSVFLFLCMEVAIFAMNLCWMYLPRENYAQVGCWYMLAKAGVMVSLGWAVIRWRKNMPEGKLRLREAALVFLLPGFSTFFLYSLLKMGIVYWQLYGVRLIALNCLAMILLNVYFLYLFGYLEKSRRMEREMELLQTQSELQCQYYRDLEQKYRESRKVFHDIRNHLQAVEQLYAKEDKAAGDNYVKDLYHMMNVYGEQFYSGNRMVNIILNEKLGEARRAGIQVTAEIGDAEFDDLRDVDITAIFANLLDNALEAARAAGPGAFLEIKIDAVRQFRVISIRNARPQRHSGTQEPVPESPGDREEASSLEPGVIRDAGESRNPGSPHGTGADPGLEGLWRRHRHMGLGLVNVRRTVEKYHGTLEQTVTEREYKVSIMIPEE